MIYQPGRAEKTADGLWHITVRFGFVEAPSLPLALREATMQAPTGCFPQPDVRMGGPG